MSSLKKEYLEKHINWGSVLIHQMKQKIYFSVGLFNLIKEKIIPRANKTDHNTSGESRS